MTMNTQEAHRNGMIDSLETDHLTVSYPFPLDAVVLAGTHQNPNRLIAGRNKAFLEVGGQKLIRYVTDALLKAECINQIFVVGPPAELLEALPNVPSRVRVIAQRGKMMTNCWAGIEASEDAHRYDTDVPVAERPLLIISCDLPLVTSASIDDFIRRCAKIDHASEPPAAMLVGVVDEPGVTPFYPQGDLPGIERPFVELAGGRLRLANIYVGRPRQMAHQEILQTGFTYRKAKDWRNVVALVYSFFRRPHGWHSAWLTMRVQLTLMLSKGKGRFYRRLKAGNTEARVEKCFSEVLGGPVKIVVSPYGGLSLDVDDEEDYQILNARYSDWAAITAAVGVSVEKNQRKSRPECDQQNR
jgi:GTP:adenosylcobinamide-phosphate guanylyltransferase